MRCCRRHAVLPRATHRRGQPDERLVNAHARGDERLDSEARARLVLDWLYTGTCAVVQRLSFPLSSFQFAFTLFTTRLARLALTKYDPYDAPAPETHSSAQPHRCPARCTIRVRSCVGSTERSPPATRPSVVGNRRGVFFSVAVFCLCCLCN